MSYADLLEDESAAQNFFGVLCPRRRVNSFTLFSGSVYSMAFDYGKVISIEEDGVALTEGASPSLSAGQWYYDLEAETLYVRASDSADPDTHFTVATFEVYVATLGRHWYRDPLDDTSGSVYYEPLIKQSPQLKSKISGTLLGFMPVESSSLSLSDPSSAKTFSRIIYDSSFNEGAVRLYHWLARNLTLDLTTDNISLVYDGQMSNINYELSELTIQLFDRSDVLAEEYRNDDTSFFSFTDFPTLDPNFVAAPIRYVYGVVDGFKPVNIDYADPASTSDNRVFVCIGEQVNLANIDASVTTGSTGTTTVVTGITHGFRVGDRVHLDRVVGTDEYVELTSVSIGVSTTTLGHANLSGGAMANGDAARRSFVAQVNITQNGTVYKLMFNRDYSTSPALAAGTAGFTLANNFEANHSGMTTFLPTDQISTRIYGRTNDVEFSGPTPVGGDDSESGNLTNPVAIILDLLLNQLGVPESSINTASFLTEVANSTDALGFSIPENATDSFPSYKDLILKISQSSLLRLFIDNDLKWKIGRITTPDTPSKTIRIDEILTGSFSYEFDYKDLVSEVVVSYARKEIPDSPLAFESSFMKATSSSDVAIFLHKVVKTLAIESFHFKSADAETLADQMVFVFGERQGKLSLRVKSRFFDSLINDTIRVSIPALPFDAPFNIDTERARDFVVESISKGSKSVTIGLDDSKGIVDNSGSF